MLGIVMVVACDVFLFVRLMTVILSAEIKFQIVLFTIVFRRKRGFGTSKKTVNCQPAKNSIMIGAEFLTGRLHPLEHFV
jgi:hypothetical protein